MKKATTRSYREQLLLTSAVVLCVCGSVHADITSGLAGYLKMDETTGLSAADATGHGHAATLLNFANDDSQWVSGRTNGACWFNSSLTNYATLADPGNALDFSASASPAFTLAVWVRGDLGASQLPGAGLICKGFGRGGEQYFLDQYQNSYRFFVRGNDNAGYVIQASQPATTINVRPPEENVISGLWQLVVGVYDSTQQGTNRMKLYLDGQLVARQASGPAALYATAHDVSIAAREDTASSGYNLPFTGRIDEVRIYDRALSESDMQELYAAAGPLVPEILAQPANATLYVGDPVTFSVVADGSLPMTYQWKHDGNEIPGATSPTHTITSVQLADAGAYSVAVTNAVGYAISDSAVITVTDPPADLANGLVAHLKLDESSGTTAFDATPNGHNATLINAPFDDSQWVAGWDLGGLKCADGSYATIDDSGGSLDFGNSATPAFTAAVWIQATPDVQINDAALIAKGYGNGGEQFTMDIHNGVYRFFLRDGAGGGGYDLNSTASANGAWQHLVAVYNHTNAQKFYVNGQLVAVRSAGPATLLSTLHEVSLGSRESGSATGYDRPFTGVLDDVRLYNRALTPTEVQMLYTNAGVFKPEIIAQTGDTTNFVLSASSLSAVAQGTEPLSYQWYKEGVGVLDATNATLAFAASQLTDSGTYSLVITNAYGSVTSTPVYLAIVDLAPDDYTVGLVGRWDFEENSGWTAKDSSGSGNDLGLVNFPFDDSQWVTTARVGNRALRFNSTADDPTAGNDYCRTLNPLSLPYNNDLFTFAFWIKLDSASYATYPRIITPEHNGPGSDNQHWILWKRTSTIGLGFYLPKATPIPLLNVWRHFTVTYDRAANRYWLYVNGVQVLADIAPNQTKATPDPYWILGHNENLSVDSDWFRGQLDDVRIYNRILSPTQVAALYASAPPFLQLISQPQPVTAPERSPVTFTVAADSSEPINYQWKKDGILIPGATNSALTFNYVALTDAGIYSVDLSNGAGVVHSAGAALQVDPLPVADIASGLVLHYTFDETSGDVAQDSSGAGYSATLNSWDESAPKWEPGVLGNALRFNSIGTSNYVQTPSSIIYPNDNTSFTFTFWAKRGPEAISNNPRIFATADYQSWVVWRPGFGIGFWNGGWGSPEPQTAMWHHYVVVFDRAANRYTVYVDGTRRVVNGTPTNPATLDDPNGYPWVIGHREQVSVPQDQESFRGWLDDMRIYNRLFTINDAEALYQAGNPQPTLSLQSEGGTLIFSWPSWASDFALQSTSQILPSGMTWDDVPGTVVLNDATLSQAETVGTGAKYYRLARQAP